MDRSPGPFIMRWQQDGGHKTKAHELVRQQLKRKDTQVSACLIKISS